VNKKHLRSDFDDFLKEEKLDSANILVIKRVIAYQIAEEMKKKKLSKTKMASRMKTSRAASAVGKKLKVQLA